MIPCMDTLYKFEHCLKLIDLENKESIILGNVNSDILSKNPACIDTEMDFITKLFQYDQLVKIPPELQKTVHLQLTTFIQTNRMYYL
jgi:hypothetical protein